MSAIMRQRRLAWILFAGLALGLAIAASPLTCLLLVATPWLVRLAGAGLPASERRLLTTLLLAALAVRLVIIVAQAMAGLPLHNSLSVGSLSGDEAYNLSRALRTRDAWVGGATSHYDYFVVYDEYGRSSYLAFLTWLQVLFGPTPFSAKLLNGQVFVAGLVLLFRLLRPSIGAAASFGALALLLFLPSLLHTSVSLLKESPHLFVTALLLVSVVRLTRARRIWPIAGWLLLASLCLWLLEDLRREGLVLALGGLALGAAIYGLVAWPRLAMGAAVLAIAGALAAGAAPGLRDRSLRAVESVAKIHSGHVFTVGHSYQLLDEGFYTKPSPAAASSIELTAGQAARFVIRAGASFVLTPLPWESRSLRELAFVPEQLLWYGMVALLPAGLIAGWRRDALVTSLFAGYGATIAAVIAMTTGNVGTLLRLRGLVTPVICWFSVLGLIAVVQAVARRNSLLPAAHPSADPR